MSAHHREPAKFNGLTINQRKRILDHKRSVDQDAYIIEQSDHIYKKQERAMRSQRWIMLEKQMKGSNFMVKHENVIKSKAVQREHAELRNLRDYVLRQKKFGELQVTKQTEHHWAANQKKQKYGDRKEKAAEQRNSIAKAQEKRRKSLIKNYTGKDDYVKNFKNQCNTENLMRKEIAIMKQAEAMENMVIAKNVRLYQKQALVDKFNEIDEQQGLFREHQSGLAQMKHNNDVSRRAML